MSQTYVRNINISNTTVTNIYITNVYNHNVRDIHYVNRNAPGAITAVSQTTFTSAQSVGRNAVRLSRNELSAATASPTAPAITPGRQSVLGAGATGARIRRPPPALQNRQVLAKTTPPPAPVPFAAQQQAIQANGGRPIARSELKSVGVYAPGAQVRLTVPAAGGESRSGMNRAARPEPAAAAIRPAGTATTVDRPPTAAPVASPASIVQAPAAPQAVAPQREGQPFSRVDRPPTAFGQPAIAERARANDVPRSGNARSPVAQDMTRRMDRPTAPPPAPVHAPVPTMPVAPPPPPSPPPVQVARPPAPESRSKPASRADTPTHPATRNNN